MSISITTPSPNATVHSPFPVGGNYSIGATGGTIVVTVYQSDGTTPLANTIVNPAVLNLPINVPTGTWQVTVGHNGSYNGAFIKAVLTPTGGSPEQATVSGINIS